MSRIYDASALTLRRAQQAAAGGFYNQQNSIGWGSRPTVGIKDSSIMNLVRVGGMTEITRYPTCIGISPGCPCGPLISSIINPPYVPALPGWVSGITFTVGSIIVSWQAPTSGDGPFTYLITPYLNGVAQTTVETSDTSYRFTGLTDWQPYTFSVCAKNVAGTGPILPSSAMLAPPSDLSAFLASLSAHTTSSYDPSVCVSYILNCCMDDMLKTLSAANIGPTRGARMMYLYVASLAQAWNWVTADTNVSGVQDNWDWTNNKASTPLSTADAIVWFICATKYINSFATTIPSVFSCPADVVARVEAAGDWDGWVSAWSSWYANRMADGSAAATTAQPTDSANWNQTIVVDGITVNNIAGFPALQEWTRLTVKGKQQSYLTHNWDSVQSTCLSAEEESIIQGSVQPVFGADRDAEIDMVLHMSANLTNQEKSIAEFWAGSAPNDMSPPLMAMWLCKEYLRTGTTSCQMSIYSLLDLAIHLFEGSRVTWGLKSVFMQARPIQEIRRRYNAQSVQSWNGTIMGEQWTPYQSPNFVTPPFADFPSGHSHFMKAFALTMNKWFGSTIHARPITYDGQTLFSPLFSTNQTTTFGTFTVPAGSSTVEPVFSPSVPVTLTFTTWDDMADSAGMSRLYGGIHCASAHYASQATAVQVDGYINSTWNIATA